MFFKKGLRFLAGVLLLCSVVVLGVAYDAAAESVRITVAGGSIGGSWSVFTEGAVEAMRRGNPDYQISSEPGNTIANPGMVDEGRLQMALSFGLTALQAYQGTGRYTTPLANIRAACCLIPVNAFQFVVTKSSGITSFEQIKDKKIPLKLSVDNKGSVGDISTSAVLEAYGITYNDIEQWGGKIFYLSSAKTFEMMSDNRIDATGDCIPVPSGDIIEASTSLDLRMLPMSDAAIDIVDKKLGMGKTIVPKDAYSFLDQDIPTVNTPVILLVNANVSDEVVYNLVKSLHSNISYLKNVAKGYADLNDQTIVQVNNVPFHPGAEKYFKEIGLLK